MSQTKWPPSSLPILKLDDLGAKQACEVFYTTQYEMLWGLPTVGFLFSGMPVLAYILSNKQEEDVHSTLSSLLGLRTIQYNGTIMNSNADQESETQRSCVALLSQGPR